MFIKKVSSLFLATLFLLLPFQAFAENPEVADSTPANLVEGGFAEGEVLVKFKEEELDVSSFFDSLSLNHFANVNHLEKKEIFEDANLTLLESQTENTQELVERLEKDARVEYAEPNYVREFQATPSIAPDDVFFIKQWGMNNEGQSLVNGFDLVPDSDIDAPEAWEKLGTMKAQNAIVVGVLDTGVAYHHPDLVENMWDGSTGCKDEENNDIADGCPNHGWDFANNDSDPIDDHGHGTHVSGIIGAKGKNARGIAGVDWNVKIMALKVGGANGVFSSDWIKALQFAKNNGAKIVNASFGGAAFSQAEKDAIAAFDGLFIAAAGNSASDNDQVHFYPSDYDLPNIISVTSTNFLDQLSSFANFGVQSVDVAAPGSFIYSTYPVFLNAGIDRSVEIGGEDYEFLSGTSMAAPVVTGEAAMIWSLHSSLTAAQVKNIIEQTGDEKDFLKEKISSGKMANLLNALNVFQPTIEFSATNYAVQSTDGKGIVTLSYALKDGVSGLPFTLKNFEYSLDGGETFLVPANGDLSEALSSGWDQGDDKVSSEDVFYTFTFDTRHSDVTGFQNIDQNNVIVRFQADDGVVQSDFIPTPSFRVNNALPVATIPENPSSNLRSINLTVGGEKVVSYQFRLDQNEWSPDTAITFPIQFSELTDGEHVLEIKGIDAEGNRQEEVTSVSWSINTIGLPFVGLLNTPEVLSNKNQISLGVGGEGIVAYKASLDGSDFSDEVLIDTLLEFNELSEGRHRIRVLGKNDQDVWQMEPDATVFSWLIDTTGPVVDFTSVPNGSINNTKPPFKISIADVGAGIEKAKVRFSCNQEQWTEFEDFKTDQENFDIRTELYGCSSTDGEKVIFAQGQDSLGNSGVVAESSKFTLDTVAPAITDLKSFTTPAKIATWAWNSGDSGDVYRFSIDRLETGAPAGDYTTIKTANQANGDGLFYLHVQAKDAAGNESAVMTVSAALDNTPPVAVLSSTPASPTTNTAFQANVGGVEVTHYKFKLDSGAFGTETVIQTPISLTSLAVGEHTLLAIGRDAAGNYQTEAGATKFTWKIEAPVVVNVSTNSGSAGGGGGGNQPAFSQVLSPVFSPTFTPSPSPQVLGAQTQKFADGTLIKLKGKTQYYFIDNGQKVAISTAVFRKKYRRLKIKPIEVDRKILRSIPTRKAQKVAKKK